MIYINEAKYKNPTNTRIGWVINEAAPDPELMGSTRVVTKHENGRRVIGEGVLQRANNKNRNGRWYDDKELFPQLTCPRTNELLAAGQMLGEDGHPMSQELQRQATIDPTNTVVRYLKFWTEGDLVKSRFMGTNNALGETFDLDLRDGYKPAFSLRALGSIVNTPNGAEVKGIKLITYDHVIYPSHPEAYTSGLVNESTSYLKTESGIYVRSGELTPEQRTVAESGIVMPVTNQAVLDCIQQESMNFNKIVEMFDSFYDSITLLNEGSVQIANSATGDAYVVNLEQYVRNEIMKYCIK